MHGKLVIARTELSAYDYTTNTDTTHYKYLEDQVAKYEYRKVLAQQALDELSGASTE